MQQHDGFTLLESGGASCGGAHCDRDKEQLPPGVQAQYYYWQITLIKEMTQLQVRVLLALEQHTHLYHLLQSIPKGSLQGTLDAHLHGGGRRCTCAARTLHISQVVRVLQALQREQAWSQILIFIVLLLQ